MNGVFIRSILAAAGQLLLCANLVHAGAEREASKYDEQWALVVGINYQGGPPEAEQLQYAESDAEEFHALIEKNYGFHGDNVSILLGDKAKKAEIENRLEDICNRAGEDACVIVYFSGHGYRDGRGRNHGELLAADVQFSEEKLPRASTVVEMKWICEKLETCKARHKLLILDCCHSGSVFTDFGRGASAFDAKRIDEAVFRSPGFQAMTASRDVQKAKDGKDGHSPFTDALLKALVNLPTAQGKGEAFTTTELFSGMQWYLDQNLDDQAQSPRCSWLDGGQGELHFFPEGEFPSPDVPDDRMQKVMLAMVPGSFDHWWFEETPWFMPGLRYEVLSLNELERSSTMDMISPLRLEQAAIETRNKLQSDRRPDIRRRLKHFDKLFAAKDDETQWDAVITDVTDDLAEAVKATETQGENPADEVSIDPVDLHFLAVLQHASRSPSAKEHKSNHEKAKVNYDLAISLYRKHSEFQRASKPLLALCLADRGLYATTVERNYEQACEYFRNARSVFGNLTPPPFQVYVLCREAEALAKLGRRGEAKKQLEEAYAAARKADPQGTTSLTAALHHRKAWLEMDWCEFDDAIQDFKLSSNVLKDISDHDREAAIMRMHNDHGIAMATRYQGDSVAALEMYRNLLQDEIYKLFREMREQVGRESNYRQIKSRLTERFVNAMERCGDCSLYGAPMDVAEAADDYRRALRAVNYLSPDKSQAWERKIRQKLALTLVLPNSGIQDLDRAADLLAEVDEITASMPVSLQKFETNLEIRDKLVRLLIAHCRSLSPCDANGGECVDIQQLDSDLMAFRAYLSKLAHDNFLDSSLARDDLENAMFALRVVLEDFPDPTLLADASGKDRVRRLKDIELLLDYCRLGRSGGPGAAQFVRPYYDTAIASLIDLKPKHAKQLIEVAWEATQGKIHFKPRNRQPTLLLYCGKKGNYFFLDVPNKTSAYYGLDPTISFDRIVSASHGDPPSEQLGLPSELQKEMFVINGTVNLCWRDKVRQLGIGMPKTHEMLKPLIDGKQVGQMIDRQLFVLQPVGNFPFALPTSVRVADVELETQPPSVPKVDPAPKSADNSDGIAKTDQE